MDIKIIIIIFLIYTFIGAILEHISYYIGTKIFNSKPKTLSNPVITGFPLYGLGGLLIWILYDKYLREYNMIILFFIFGSTITLIEYIVGKYIVNAGKFSVLNNKLINGIESWDYSNEPFNYKGIISLRHFITWGLLSLLIIKVHPILEDKLICLFK